MEKTYHGSCHCRRVRFEADIDFDKGTSRCNCSICSKKRAWNVSVKPDAFRLLAGKDDLGDYQFATGQGHHRFCRNCGVTGFGEGDIKELGGAFVSISVAALDDLGARGARPAADPLYGRPSRQLDAAAETHEVPLSSCPYGPAVRGTTHRRSPVARPSRGCVSVVPCGSSAIGETSW